MKSVLLTGGSGFVGKHLNKYIKDNVGWKVLTIKDITLNELKAIGRVDYVINLASNSNVEQSIKWPLDVIDNNVTLMLAMLEYARLYPPEVFFHMSTVEVYNVTNPYAASKAAQEELANAYWKTYDVPIVIARSSNIIGEGQSKGKFVPKIIEQIKKGETVTIYKSGTRVYVPIENVCSAIVYLIQNYPKVTSDKELGFPVHYDIGGGKNLTNLQMAMRVAKLLDETLKYELVEPTNVRPTYAKSLMPRGAKLENYHWKPPVTLEESMSWIR